MLKVSLSPVLIVSCCAGAFAGDAVSAADLKKLPGLGEFKARPYIEAAAALQKLGKDDALRVLREVAADGRQANPRVHILCRMLFQAKQGKDFRGPLLGDPGRFAGTDVVNWPLNPIAVIDGIPFALTQGYLLAGRDEPASDYLAFCVENCEWNSARFKASSADEMSKALQRLLAMPNVRAGITDRDKKFFEEQIK